MKRSTQLDKLNEILGIKAKAEEVATRSTGKVIGVTEEEIQTFREAQGLIYFLQAPALFTPKTCKHCGEHFVVSRKYVAFCSYTCIEKSLEEMGISWSRKGDIEGLIESSVFEGQEPIWIRSPILKRIQQIISDTGLEVLNTPSESPSTSLVIGPSQSESTGEFKVTTAPGQLSSVPHTNTSQTDGKELLDDSSNQNFKKPAVISIDSF